MAKKLVDRIDAVWSEESYLYVTEHPESVPYVMDCIAQIVFEVVVNRLGNWLWL